MSRREVRVGLRHLEPLDHLLHGADQRLELRVADILGRAARPLQLGRDHRLGKPLHGRMSRGQRRLPRLVVELQLQPVALFAGRQRRGQRLGNQVRQRRKLPLDQDHAAVRPGHRDQVGPRPPQCERANQRRLVHRVGLQHERHDHLRGLGDFLGGLVGGNVGGRLGAGDGVVQLLKERGLGGMAGRTWASTVARATIRRDL